MAKIDEIVHGSIVLDEKVADFGVGSAGANMHVISALKPYL